MLRTGSFALPEQFDAVADLHWIAGKPMREALLEAVEHQVRVASWTRFQCMLCIPIIHTRLVYRCTDAGYDDVSNSHMGTAG